MALYESPSNSCWHSSTVQKYQTHGGPQGKVRRPPKSWEFILRETRASFQNEMAIHAVVAEMCQSGPNCWTHIAIPRTTLAPWLKNHCFQLFKPLKLKFLCLSLSYFIINHIFWGFGVCYKKIWRLYFPLRELKGRNFINSAMLCTKWLLDKMRKHSNHQFNWSSKNPH